MIAVAIRLVLLFLAHAILSLFLLLRPERVISAIAGRAKEGAAGYGVLNLIAETPPYAWLLQGRGWESFIEIGRSPPYDLPRMVMAVRSLGGLSLGVNLFIMVFAIVLTLT